MTWNVHNPDQWLILIVSVLSLTFGSGLFYKIRARRGSERLQRGTSSTSPTTPVEPSPHIAESDKPVFHQNLKLPLGDYGFIQWHGHKIRVTFMNLVKEQFTLFHSTKETFGAELDFDVGGGLVYGGECTKKTGVNRLLLPAKDFSEEEPYSAYYFHTHDNSFTFVRVFVDHINPHAKEIVLDVFCATK